MSKYTRKQKTTGPTQDEFIGFWDKVFHKVEH